MPAPATQVSRPTPPPSGAAEATIDAGAHHSNTAQLGIKPGPEAAALRRLIALGAQCGVTINCGGSYA
jgi:hypothetical protein